MAERKDRPLPTGRVQRAAKVGKVVGGQGAKIAGTRAANVTRNREDSELALERRHREAAAAMVKTLGNLRGAAMKLGQLASFVDVDFMPPEYRELYQEELAQLRSQAPPMPWRQVEKVVTASFDEPIAKLFDEFDHEASAAASIGQVHKAVLKDGREVAVKIQYPEVADALRADLQNVGVLVRLAKAVAPGLDAKAVARELKERVLEELDYELEAQNQRRFARAYRGHPFIYVPGVVTSLSRQRVLVTEWVDGYDFEYMRALSQAQRNRVGEIIFRFCFGSIYHLQQLNADAHPGNYILMNDGRIAFLDYGMTKRLNSNQLALQVAAVEAVLEDNPDALFDALNRLGFIRRLTRADAEQLMGHIRSVGGWYLSGKRKKITSKTVMAIMTATSDPRSEFFKTMRHETMPADELLGRRMETGVLAVLGQLEATANWTAIGSEWWFGDSPSTELGVAEWEYFKGRGKQQVPMRWRGDSEAG